MVKLQSKDEPSTCFYFKDMKRCNEFINIFKGHWCNVRWNPPVEKPDFPEMDRFQREKLEQDPKERAENNLSWGFALDDYLGRGLNNEQNAFVSAMVERTRI